MLLNIVMIYKLMSIYQSSNEFLSIIFLLILMNFATKNGSKLIKFYLFLLLCNRYKLDKIKKKRKSGKHNVY